MFAGQIPENSLVRIGSPWDDLLSAGPLAISLAARDVTYIENEGVRVIPKLAPEIEEGAVEYKLQILSPSATRFTKLVTQLKWRLLEGGGEALYEVGVADSGQLIGLSRDDLERSLETLENMADEIGASLVVVKEIEVPRTRRIGWAGLQVGGAVKVPKLRLVASSSSATESSSESGADADEVSSMDELPFSVKEGDVCTNRQQYHRSNPSVPSSQSSPLFSPGDKEVDNIYNLQLEIASVYKPRPTRSRSAAPSVHGDNLTGSARAPSHDMFDIGLDIGAEMEALSLASRSASSTRLPTPRVPVSKDPVNVVDKMLEKKNKKRHRRDANRAKRRVSPYRSCRADVARSEQHWVKVDSPEVAELLAPVPMEAAIPVMNPDTPSLIPSSEGLNLLSPSPGTPDSGNDDSMQDVTSFLNEDDDRRFIVEVLVFRKMLADECFLDFLGSREVEM